MIPIIQLHGVEKLHLEPLIHFPPEDGRAEFWSRSMVCWDRERKVVTLQLFSDAAGKLMTPEEAQARRCEVAVPRR